MVYYHPRAASYLQAASRHGSFDQVADRPFGDESLGTRFVNAFEEHIRAQREVEERVQREAQAQEEDQVWVVSGQVSMRFERNRMARRNQHTEAPVNAYHGFSPYRNEREETRGRNGSS